MASNDTKSSQAVAQGMSVKFMALLDKREQVRERKLEYNKMYSDFFSRAIRRTSFSMSPSEEDENEEARKEAVYGASLATLTKRDGFEAWLEEVQKKKMAAIQSRFMD